MQFSCSMCWKICMMAWQFSRALARIKIMYLFSLSLAERCLWKITGRYLVHLCYTFWNCGGISCTPNWENKFVRELYFVFIYFRFSFTFSKCAWPNTQRGNEKVLNCISWKFWPKILLSLRISFWNIRDRKYTHSWYFQTKAI